MCSLSWCGVTLPATLQLSTHSGFHHWAVPVGQASGASSHGKSHWYTKTAWLFLRKEWIGLTKYPKIIKEHPWKMKPVAVLNRLCLTVSWASGMLPVLNEQLPANSFWDLWDWTNSQEIKDNKDAYIYTSGQIIIFHQPRFPWNKWISFTKPPFGVMSCEVAIIWADTCICKYINHDRMSL